LDPKARISTQDRRHDLMALQPNPSRTKTESTGAGEQHVIPGAEKVSDAEVAKRKAGQPLKPQVAQKPADHGLFSDESKQIDFIDEPVASPQVESTRASMSFMITQQQKETLRGLGYSEERIWKMKPEDAHAILKEAIKV
jgi:hypothetical protein